MHPVTDTKAVQQLFDELASEYDQHIPFFATFGRSLVTWCGLQPGQRVLDIAAGRGAVAGPAALAVGPRGEVLAIDNASGMLRALSADHRDLPQLTTCVMDAHGLRFQDARFDAVTCGFAFHFLDDPEQAIAEARRVLRPGGLLAFSGPPTGPLPQICAEAGFTGIEQRSEQATFAIRDPQHYWDWSMSHGFRGYVDSLGPELAGEFRARMFAGLERMHANGGITVECSASSGSARPAADLG
jgi:ubiquinone/menaquinone biosynthesis C-methylase UbiE